MGGEGSGRRARTTKARCFQHPGSSITASGSYSTSSGTRRRYRCVPVLGDPHTFSVLIGPADDAPQGPAAAAARWSPAPPCPEHPGSKVVRNGKYGSKTPKPRQRYRCTPADGSKPHSFTPPLPRDHVHENAEDCAHCEELRGVHRGDTAVARRHSWSTRVVARGLEKLAEGSTYADVGRWALRVTGTQRTRAVPVQDPDPDLEGKPKRVSPGSRESRRTWHIAADWCEAFSPVVYRPIDEQLRTAALAERARLDERAERGEDLDRPQVVLIDDVPVYGRDLGAKTRSRRDRGYFILCLAEVVWPEPTPDDEPDPFGTPLLSTQKLRLMRAMPKSNTACWRLVFDELGYTPDFIVADGGTGIAAAVAAHYGGAATKFVPSLWHLTRAVENALTDTPGAFVVARNGSGKELVEPVAELTSKLSRYSGVLESPGAWSKWWDELFDTLKAAKLPTNRLVAVRRNYEQPMALVLDDLAALPGVPVSTGGLETLIAKNVTPLLAMRRTSFANIERTNLLFDLAVARHHGAFDDIGEVTRLLRDDTTGHGGWTVPLRSIADPRPPGGTYSSLRDTALVSSLVRDRGLA